MNRTKKEEVVAEFHSKFQEIQGAVLTNYQGLSVAAISEIRRAFREEGVHFQVVKNRLAQIASKDTPLEVIQGDFVGPVAIAYSQEDATAPARVAFKCAEKEEKFEITCGYVDNERLDASGVETLSKLPTRDELRAQLLRVCNAPATKLVRTFNAVPQQIAILLSNFKEQAESGE